MMAVLWNDIERDVSSSRRHFAKAIEVFGHLRGASGEENYYFQTAAFMHAMLSGYTSFEAAMKRLLALLGEPLPSGSDWHTALVQRIATADVGSRPAILDDAALVRAVSGLRGFRHVAAHAYDEFDEDRAALAARDAETFLAEIDPTLARFRAIIDPD